MSEKVFDKEGSELITPQESEARGYLKESTIRMRLRAGTLTGIKKGDVWLVKKNDVKGKSKN